MSVDFIYTAAPPPSISTANTIVGRGIARRGLGKQTLADLGGAMSLGLVDVHKPSVTQAARMLRVPVSIVRKARAKLLAERGDDHHGDQHHGNSDGAFVTEPTITWAEFTSEEKSEFLKAHFNEIWAELEMRTS
jgi:hypothetical protein